MWLLESDGKTFCGQTIWLRPGKRYIFGRIRPSAVKEGGYIIIHRTVSRKHLVVNVAAVMPRDCMFGLRSGTRVNNSRIMGRHVLDKESYDIQLGSYNELFHITWKPIVLAFSLTSKDLRADRMWSFCEKLKCLDIKIYVGYIQKSTHVVARNCNTLECLRGLINGKYIVHPNFIDAIATVTASEEDTTSPLQSLWPNELQYLPQGSERMGKPAAAYAPDPKRQTIFEGYTFIFYNKSQFENLRSPIEDGHGRALLRQIGSSAAKVEDFVLFVKDVAGEKGFGQFQDSKGVFVVRYQPAEEPIFAWYSELARYVSLSLGHRLIEQEEFLNVILNNDASSLYKPLEFGLSTPMLPETILASQVRIQALVPAVAPTPAIQTNNQLRFRPLPIESAHANPPIKEEKSEEFLDQPAPAAVNPSCGLLKRKTFDRGVTDESVTRTRREFRVRLEMGA